MKATPKTSRKVRDYAQEAYEDGYLLEEWEDDHGKGSFRSVIVEDDIAYKFARNDEYAYMNKAEWDAYHKFPASVKSITTKPLAISNCGRVMAIEAVEKTLYDTYRDDNNDDYTYEAREFNEKLRELLKDSGEFSDGEVAHLMSDNHENNIGVRNGKLLWIDFAGCG